MNEVYGVCDMEDNTMPIVTAITKCIVWCIACICLASLGQTAVKYFTVGGAAILTVEDMKEVAHDLINAEYGLTEKACDKK